MKYRLGDLIDTGQCLHLLGTGYVPLDSGVLPPLSFPIQVENILKPLDLKDDDYRKVMDLMLEDIDLRSPSLSSLITWGLSLPGKRLAGALGGCWMMLKLSIYSIPFGCGFGDFVDLGVFGLEFCLELAVLKLAMFVTLFIVSAGLG